MRICGAVVNHNYQVFVGVAIDSLLEQRDPFDEIVVVDDGSTDGSRNVLAGYVDRVRLVAQPNGGQLSACLTVIENTTCDFVYFLDADDRADPALVEQVRPLLMSRPAKVQFQLQTILGDGSTIDSVFPSLASSYGAAAAAKDNEELGLYQCPPTSGNIFSVAAVRAVIHDGLDRRDFVDGPVAMAMPYVGELVSVPVVLGYYRQHGDNHSGRSRVTPEQLESEVSWCRDRWRQAAGCGSVPDIDLDATAYVLGRILMARALRGGSLSLSMALQHLRVVARSRLPRASKALLVGWTLALLVPWSRTRIALVSARRSALARPAAVNALIVFLKRAAMTLSRVREGNDR